MKSTSHSESRLKILGKLDLNEQNNRKVNVSGGKGVITLRDVHGSLEQFVQAVHPLHQLKRDADQKELLQLIDDVATSANSHRDVREETTASDDDVENVPPVGTETSPAKSVEAHMDVHHVHDGDKEEKIICTHSIRARPIPRIRGLLRRSSYVL